MTALTPLNSSELPSITQDLILFSCRMQLDEIYLIFWIEIRYQSGCI